MMKTEIDTKWIATVSATLIASDAKTTVKYLGEKLVVRATWRNKPSKKNTREEMVITFGVPNYREVAFIKNLKKAGKQFPIKEIQLKPYPIKKKECK